MIDFLSYYVLDFLGLMARIYSSPLALPIALALIWRLYGNTADAAILSKGVLAPYIAVVLFPIHSGFFEAQKGLYNGILDSLQGTALLAHVRSWNLESEILPARAVQLGFLMFAGLLLYKDEPFYRSAMRFLASFLIVTLLMFVFEITLIRETLPHTIPGPSDIAQETFAQLSRQYETSVRSYLSIPLFSCASAELCYLFSIHLLAYLKHNNYSLPVWALVANLSAPTIVLFGSLYAFYVLSFASEILWIIFLSVCYPPVLAFTRTTAADLALLSLYRRGLMQLKDLILFTPPKGKVA